MARRHPVRLSVFHVLALLVGLHADALAQPRAVQLYYNERPPYLTTGPDGVVFGLTATPAAEAFRRAGIAFEWVKLPTKRQLSAIKENNGLECAVGWFKNPEREAFARYTKAIYRDRPTVGLANVDFQPPTARLADLLRTPGVTVLVKDGYSYGPYIDGLINDLKPTRLGTAGESSQMVQMVAARRADFMFVAEEEASYLVHESGIDASKLKLVRFDDVPPGERRYILCSKRVPVDVIARLNQGISFE